MTRVLVVGSGAREHALAWKLRQSPEVDALFVAPGNAGTAAVAENAPIAPTDLPGIARLVEERAIDLTVVGPEAPLAAGLADLLRSRGRRVVGPSAAAARIEASKAFAKRLMVQAGVPTAAYEVFEEPDSALRYLSAASFPLVVKADGLAAGKGVTICADLEEARTAVLAAMVGHIHGASGARVVVEEALDGPEISLLAFVDGEHAVSLPVAQDHKRLGDGDTGPNTGGMGAYAPVPFLSPQERNRLVALTVEPVIAALAREGCPYRGILFAGLMLTSSGPRVLEYNCRFGDPEAQVILPLLKDDLLPWLEAVADGRLEAVGPPPVSNGAAVGVVLAAKGYPERPRTGIPIERLDDLSPGVLAFHAGTTLDGSGKVVTAGGRVITLVGTGPTVDEAARCAYAAPVRFDGMQRREDIAWQVRSPQPPAPPPAILTGWRGRGGEGARIGVLASGDGSNLQALLDASRRGDLLAEIALVVSHRPRARALERARNAGVPTYTLPLADRHDPASRRRHEEDLLAVLRPYRLDLIVLAGWMLILSAEFLAACPCPLLNVHPALLPLEREAPVLAGVGDGFPWSPPADDPFPVLRGAHAVRDALSLGLSYTGVSVHFVTPEVDAGPVVTREVVAVAPDDDEISLYRRIKAVEHRLLPEAVRTVLYSRHAGGVYA